ncbi:MAG TPA: AAA family ATPase [Methylocella sp.]|nr:AAA family ATPase [Methylocella sp.]
MALKNLTIERFKRLERVDFNLSDVNILIGGNNSGKSTIIQAVHFAFTLLQSLNITNKWPAKAKKSSTISPTELIYIPSEDAYSLGYGGRLLEEEAKSIVIRLTFDDGEIINLSIRKGRITNIIVEPDNVQYAKTLSSLEEPYSVFSPGLAGVARTETLVSDGVLLRALARGDANAFVRNILYRLHQKDEWVQFETDLSMIFQNIRINVKFNPTTDQYIDVTVSEIGRQVPLDLAGTGLLQSVQILAYLHLFSPKLIILDEPDSHLHPNNQRLLCSLLSTVALERGVQVLVTTHSRHVLDTLRSDAKMLWVQNGTLVEADAQDQVDILLELGALDIKEKISSGNYKVIVLTEDKITQLLKKLLDNARFDENATTLLPYNGVTSVHLLNPLIRQIKEISQAAIVVHRDRDYMEPDEIEIWKKEIIAAGAEPFVTKEIDVEGYFATDEYIRLVGNGVPGFDLKAVNLKLGENELDTSIASYVNGRIDLERKSGNIAKLDYGKLSAMAAKKASANPIATMKGKKKLAKLREIFQELYGKRFEVQRDALPVDIELAAIAAKYFRDGTGRR